MEEILTKVQNLGITLDSNSAVKVAEIWFKAQIIEMVVLSVLVLSLLALAFYFVRRIGS